MVVGPSGEHIYTDKYGRVKVQFHWDRLGQRNEKSTCWMRVSQPWAGKGFGAMSIPRIGDEVVVSFLEGDPDQPLITGRVYNAQFMPPYALPANKTVTGILTRSMGKTSAAEANELRFEDAPGKEYIWLQAQKDFHREVENNDHDTVKNDQYITVAKKRQEDIGTDLEQTVGGKVKQSYASDHHHQVSGDYLHESGGVINLKSGGEFSLESGAAGGIKTSQALDIKAGMDLKAEGGMNVHIKGGMNVTIEAGMTLTLKAGAGSIVIGPATIAIDAPMVNINGGGGGGSASAANPKAPAKPAKAVKPKAVKDPITPAQGASGGAAAKSAPAAKKTAPPAAKKSAPAAKKAAPAAKATPPAAAKSAPAAKSATASTATPAAKSAPTSGTSGMLVTKKGAAYRDEQVVSYSHYNDPIDTSNGRLAGNSRVWGDAPPATQQASINALVNESKAAGLSKHDTAMVLAIARVESGFNPDAAAGTTSAAGLGQFVNRTGKAYGLTDENRWDVNAQAKALVQHYADNKKLATARGQGDAYIYKYHHDGPSGEYGGLGISENKVLPLAKQFESMLGD
jgi:Type VI secretion system/phage-baseplate injector OB domain/Transglycosylase SLT domain